MIRNKKVFNMNTYKMHSIEDYAQLMKMFVTAGNTSTQLVGAS